MRTALAIAVLALLIIVLALIIVAQELARPFIQIRRQLAAEADEEGA